MIGNILNIARNALTAHQTAVQVASQNISNSQTEGYSRQRVDMVTAPPSRVATGAIGSGVAVRDITRTRDLLLDTTFRRESANAADFGTRKDLLEQVEEVFGELSESGFGSQLDAFWSAWGDLANDPSNGSVRGLVKERGQQVVFALNDYAARLSAMQQSVSGRVERSVVEVNTLAGRLADINREVLISRASGGDTPDLYDERDKVLDQLSTLAQVQVTVRDDGSAAVHIGTLTLVDGSDSRAVSMDPVTRKLTLGTTTLHDIGGSLGAMVAVRDEEIPTVQARLDDFTATLVNEVNGVHFAGTGRNFFDANPLRRTAATIQLSGDIADAGDVGTVPLAPSDNRVALAMAQLRTDPATFGSGAVRTFSAFYSELVSDIGVKVNTADRSSTIYETLAQQADVRRASISGVNTDEELMQLMKHQQAYQAATRLVATADEMIQQILQMV